MVYWSGFVLLLFSIPFLSNSGRRCEDCRPSGIKRTLATRGHHKTSTKGTAGSKEGKAQCPPGGMCGYHCQKAMGRPSPFTKLKLAQCEFSFVCLNS